MKPVVLAFLFSSFFVCVNAQKINETFNPLIKETPQSLKILQYTDGNYLVYGDINYYDNAASGSLIKVDRFGNLLTDFQQVFTDQPIGNVQLLPSGKILVEGSFKYLNGKRTGNIALLNADGSVDTGFAIDPNSFFSRAVVQSTGKIIGITKGLNGPRIGRLNHDGSDDPTFSANFFPTILIQLLVDDNDQIYVVDNSPITNPVIYRLTTDGALDPSYNFPKDPAKTFRAAAIQPDGRLVAAVTNIVSNAPYTVVYTIERFNTDGTIDNTFHAGNASSQIDAIAIRKNGKIAFTGNFNSFDSQWGNAMELNSDGSLNRVLFNTNYNGMYSICEDNDENIFVTGGFKSVNGKSGIKLIAKIRPTYELDRSFNLPVFRTAGSHPFLVLAAQSDDKLLVGGQFFFGGVGSDTSKLVRTLPNGNVDNGFLLRYQSNNFNKGFVNAVAVQDDDKFIIGGASNNFNPPLTSVIWRFLPDGEPDNSFQIGSGPSFSNGYFVPGVRFIKIKNSKIYIVGSFDRFNGHVCRSFAILDQDGNVIGPAKNELPEGSHISDMEIQSDGKVIFMGSFALSETDIRNYLRLNSDGSIDTSFKLDNLQGVFDLEVDEHDNILIAGSHLDNQPGKMLIRFTPNGERDNSLDQRSGFMLSDPYSIAAYTVKSLNNDMIAVTGRFSGYQNTISPGVIIMDKNGSVIPFDNSFDSTSFGLVSHYSNNTLYVAGRFSKKGTEILGAVKIQLPANRVATNFASKATSPSTILLSWDAKSEDQFVIEASSPDQSNYQVIATIPSASESYEVRDLDEVTPYHFRIRSEIETPLTSALFAGTDTTWIRPQVALPATDITDESFTANWTYIPGTDSCLLQVSDDNFKSFVPGYGNLIVNGGSTPVISLEDDNVYQYRVKRFKNRKASEFSESIIVNVITEIEESPLKVKVYPNPVSDYLSIDLPENISSADVVVHSVAGVIVGKYSFTDKTSSKIDLRNLPHGVFILTISSKGMSKKYKLVRSE